jgi:hypothetical protein
MSEPVIAPDEAFRAILRAQYRRRAALADEIRDVYWFHYWRRNEVPQEEHCVASRVSEWLHEQQRTGKLRLRGVLDVTKPPQDIDPIDVQAGELRIWDRELKIYGEGGHTDRTYRLVHIVAVDIQAAIAPADPVMRLVDGRKRPRYPGDPSLIERGLALIDAGTATNALHAAEILAPEAEGTRPEQTVDRLRKAIRKAIAAR